MRVRWANEAIRDLERIRRFLGRVNPRAAQEAVGALRKAPRRLAEHPRLGVGLDQFEGRDVRKLIVGSYELRYEVMQDEILVLHIWHGREDR